MTNNFLFIIGAPKCGTSSLADWLGRDTRLLLMENKEPGYFRTGEKRWVINAHLPDVYHEPAPGSPMLDFNSYMALSEPARHDQWVIDASTDYFSDKNAAQGIRDFATQRKVKIVCILRDPVERAFSEYCHTVRDGLEPLSFRESIDQEEDRRARRFQPLFFHCQRSRYHDALRQFWRLFGEDVLVLSHSELARPANLADKIGAFLSIGKIEAGPIGHLNVSRPHKRGPQNDVSWRSALASLMPFAKSRNSSLRRRPIPSLEDEDRKYVFELLKNDIAKCVADSRIPTDDWPCSGGV